MGTEQPLSEHGALRYGELRQVRGTCTSISRYDENTLEWTEELVVSAWRGQHTTLEFRSIAYQVAATNTAIVLRVKWWRLHANGDSQTRRGIVLQLSHEYHPLQADGPSTSLCAHHQLFSPFEVRARVEGVPLRALPFLLSTLPPPGCRPSTPSALFL